jgi:hypothetical protein
MKTLLTKFMALSSIGLLMLSACKKDDAIVTSNGGTPAMLTASATTLVLDKTKLTDPTPAVTFNVTATNYGFSAASTNTLQIDVPSDNWAKPASVTLGTKVLSQGYSTADFNALVLKLNLPAGVASQVSVRVVNTLSANVAPVYSNTLTLTVTPFNLTSWVYVVGAYQGWNANGPDSLISVTGNGVYTGVINFTAGNNQFLILPQKGSYNNKYATNDNGPVNTTVAVGANNNLYAPSTAGYYLVTLNTNSNTISIVPADYYSVIGDAAQGWSTDVAMKYTNDLNQDWVVTLPLVSTGSFKVRQDDAWTWSWGIPNSGTAGAGVANTLNDSSNGNIPVPVSGNYVVSFSQAPTAFGATPSVTTTYSVIKQ